MFNLGNLKTNQTKTVNDVTVTKEDGHYKVVTAQGTAYLRFVKDEKQWRFVVEGHGDVEYHLPEGTTGKTAVDALVAGWPAMPEPVAKPEAAESAPKDKAETIKEKIAKLLANGNDPAVPPAVSEAYLAKAAALMAQHSVDAEELRRAEGGEAGEGDDEIVSFFMVMNNQGGHGVHRAHSYMAVIRAFGAGSYYTHNKIKGLGYRHDVIKVYVIAQADVVAKIKDFVVIMDLAMERQAAQVSRNASSHSRANGGHHSLAGCRARRGFIRGFGQGIADRLTVSTEEYAAADESGSKALVLVDRKAQVETYMALHHGNLKAVRGQAYDEQAYLQGRASGRSFASPAITESPADKEMINA